MFFKRSYAYMALINVYNIKGLLLSCEGYSNIIKIKWIKDGM